MQFMLQRELDFIDFILSKMNSSMHGAVHIMVDVGVSWGWDLRGLQVYNFKARFYSSTEVNSKFDFKYLALLP